MGREGRLAASYPSTTVEVGCAQVGRVAVLLGTLKSYKKCWEQVFLTMANAVHATRGKKAEVVRP